MSVFFYVTRLKAEELGANKVLFEAKIVDEELKLTTTRADGWNSFQFHRVQTWIP